MRTDWLRSGSTDAVSRQSSMAVKAEKRAARSMKHPRTLTLAHWGVYEVEYDQTGKAIQLHPFAKDPDPSPIGLHMLSDEVARLRVHRPAVRKSWLEQGPGSFPALRGA